MNPQDEALSVFERWPGYTEQSWSERFAELDRQHTVLREQTAQHIRHRLSHSTPGDAEVREALEEADAALEGIISRASRTYRARNGRVMSIQADDGEACLIVHSDEFSAAERALEIVRKAITPTQMEICPDCSGAGGDNNVWVCSRCNGSGGLATPSGEDKHSEATHWPTCEGCTQHIKPGHFVYTYAEGVEAHVDCEKPYATPVDPKAMFLIGDPMRLVPAVRCAAIDKEGDQIAARLCDWEKKLDAIIAGLIDTLDLLTREPPRNIAISKDIRESVAALGQVKVGLSAFSPTEPASVAGEAGAMSDDQIKHMTERFLGWRLPENFHPDAGISFKPISNIGTSFEYRHQPIGTNLFDYTQAEEMVRYMLEGLPTPGGEA